MMRVLLAAEGESDEIVAEALIKSACADVDVVRKRFPARGIAVVRRSIPTLVRAAHFQGFDRLIVHFDLDDTLVATFQNASESPRWCDINSRISDLIPTLKDVNRGRPVVWTLMTPAPATEAWLIWGRDNRDGTFWESKNRHTMKESLFGRPPRNVVRVVRELIPSLLEQINGGSRKPRTLESFLRSVKGFRSLTDHSEIWEPQ